MANAHPPGQGLCAFAPAGKKSSPASQFAEPLRILLRGREREMGRRRKKTEEGRCQRRGGREQKGQALRMSFPAMQPACRRDRGVGGLDAECACEKDCRGRETAKHGRGTSPCFPHQ
eukprot:2719421-Rhodomonas_salina.3